MTARWRRLVLLLTCLLSWVSARAAEATHDGWKLIDDPGNFSAGLYDLRRDPEEKRNLADDQAAQDLTRRLLTLNGETKKSAPAPESESFEAWLALGRLLHDRENLLEAEDALKEALTFKPDDSGARRMLAVVYQDLGLDQDAVELFEKLLKQNPQDYDLCIKLARSDMRLGRYAQSKEAFAQAKKINGKTSAAYIQEGYFHLDVGEPAQAKESFENAIAVDTASPFGYHHMGAYLAEHGQYPEAERYFRRALEMLEADPNTRPSDLLHAITWLGNMLRLQGRYVEAEAVFRKCLDMPMPSGFYIDCLHSLGMVYASENKNAQAEDVFKRAAAACDGGPPCLCRGKALIDLGEIYLKRGRRSEATTIADQVGKLCVDHATSRFSELLALAGLYVDVGSASKGEALYGLILADRSTLFEGRAISTNPRLLASEHLADLDMTHGRFHEAEDLYRQAISIWESRRDGNRFQKEEAAAFDGLAAAYEKEGKPQEAATAREKAESLRTSNY